MNILQRTVVEKSFVNASKTDKRWSEKHDIDNLYNTQVNLI